MRIAAAAPQPRATPATGRAPPPSRRCDAGAGGRARRGHRGRTPHGRRGDVDPDDAADLRRQHGAPPRRAFGRCRKADGLASWGRSPCPWALATRGDAAVRPSTVPGQEAGAEGFLRRSGADKGAAVRHLPICRGSVAPSPDSSNIQGGLSHWHEGWARRSKRTAAPSGCAGRSAPLAYLFRDPLMARHGLLGRERGGQRPMRFFHRQLFRRWAHRPLPTAGRG